MNLKWLSAAPVLALITVLLVRGLSAPPSRENAARATGPVPTVPTGEETDGGAAADSNYMALARLTFDDGVKAVVNARAVQLFNRAQQEGDAIAWLDQHCRAVAGDVAYLRQTLGTITGEGGQFGEFLNRTAEFSACNVAMHWAKEGGVATDASSVNPSAILKQYFEVYGPNEQQQQPEPAAQG